MKEKILVVDDEAAIADLVEVYLTNEGYAVFACGTAAEALEIVAREELSLAILDVMLPDMDGFALCQRIRENHLFPILMLTARGEDTDKITGLTLGADDYVTKPFSNRELIARIRANMRRFSAAEAPAAKAEGHKGLEISEEDTAVYKDGKPIDLSVREFDILSYLAAEPGRVVSREELMEKVWGFEYYGDLRAVDVAIRRLREKIEDEPAQPKYIITKRGLGYYFAKN